MKSSSPCRPSMDTAGRYSIAGIVLNLPARKSITRRRERSSHAKLLWDGLSMIRSIMCTTVPWIGEHPTHQIAWLSSSCTFVIGQFITIVAELVLRIIFGTDSGIVPDAVSSWFTDHLGDCPSKIIWGLDQLIVWLPLTQRKCLPIPSTAWTKTFWHSVRSYQCPSWDLTYHACDCVFWCECIWHVLLTPEFCPGGQRQRLTLNKSTLLV